MTRKLSTRLAASVLRCVLTLGTVGTFTLLNPGETPNPLSSQPIWAQTLDEETSIRVYEKANPAVVSIEANSDTGSGSIIRADGLILTNAHVVENTSTVRVELADGRQYQGQVLGYANNNLDLALVKIPEVNNLPTVSLAPSGSVRVGQRAFAIGNPFGQFQGTFTTGIVSRIDEEKGLIQTDAAINPGNSGGPLLNSDGELIGVNTAIFSSSRDAGNIGIGFAIPVAKIRPFLTAVEEGRASQTARVRRPNPDSVQPPQPLRLNQSVQGRLEPGDNILSGDNSFFDAYRFEATAGTRINIEMSSGQLDPYLILIAPDGSEVAQDDDGGGGRNARIVATLPLSGTYLLMANSYTRGETGNYQLQARANSTASPSATGVLLQQEGFLGTQNLRLPDGSFYEEYRFEGRAGQSVTLTLESQEFDTYLILLNAQGDKLAENDDVTDGNTNSRLTVNLPRTGVYRVLVNSYQQGERGRYRLTVR
ncbi:trypsin-like peptidase domain-containing protein [Spirulina sp. CS-785/01]|uniref:trypsin-like peptidase domain-containing protein n=1 Tax=Spirulina sp. CS-785/01 TaxID=3021716 RepID=UPI00232E9EE8|nr:trypsin-like peptidase domain-containing protein [Spirulina sp. CS-785/01]MDB9314260.1 trypsin-like peptidase domain-containing protein [Spirulina sp. CS-785/01]